MRGKSGRVEEGWILEFQTQLSHLLAIWPRQVTWFSDSAFSMVDGHNYISLELIITYNLRIASMAVIIQI